ncbi:sensor histidine kinase [Gordonia zhaorongruii]|uniref:sensor histidine kinase n=1 Tax=Gordonia zhaorongruii TaxID=2597659 RepID=UPI001053691A|nr:histidine kinase [Gordonia zhaorongruii]
MRPETYQPALTRWGHVWRLALAVAVSVVAWLPRADDQLHNVQWWLVIDLALGAVTMVTTMRWRRRYPVAVCTFANIASIVSLTAAGPAALALVSLATRRWLREIIPQMLLTVVCVIAAEVVTNPPEEDELGLLGFAMVVVICALVVAWGMYVGSRRELLSSWQARATLAEAEQHAKVREAQVAERARIAREMHDVLAHRISTISMHAGALAFRDDLPVDQVRESAQTIQETSHLAMQELREVLGVLRDGPGDADPERPQETALDLTELVEQNRRTGMRIDADRELDVAQLPPALGRTLYRCVQEALTNARKHAPDSVVWMRLSGTPGEGVELRVENPLSITGSSAPRSGLGLVGLAERVALHGGTQSYGITTERTFRLEVRLPWQA